MRVDSRRSVSRSLTSGVDLCTWANSVGHLKGSSSDSSHPLLKNVCLLILFAILVSMVKGGRNRIQPLHTICLCTFAYKERDIGSIFHVSMQNSVTHDRKLTPASLCFKTLLGIP